MSEAEFAKKMAIGERLAVLLEERRESAAWLADRIGASRSTITRIVRGERSPTPETLREIAVALGMDCRDLVVGTDARCAEEDAEQLVSRAHFEDAVAQMLKLEREVTDHRTRLRSAEEEASNERARRISLEREHAALVERHEDAERKARFHEAEARRYHDALELAVRDVARLRADMEQLGKTTDNGRRAARTAAALAGIAAVASVAAYVSRADATGKDSTGRRSTTKKRKGN